MDAPFLNLIRDPWIPVATRSGRRFPVRPCNLTLAIDNDPIVDIDWPRADFRAAQLEFLIGLLITACQPKGNSAWQRWWDKPASPDELAARFAPFEAVFDVDGPGPHFLQDQGNLGNETVPIAGLLIEQPGANTEKNNADLFVKRGQMEVLARSTAAIALYTLQAFAPSGGAGHRTSLRGGGPLTTLAVPSSKISLWHLLWLNVPPVFKESEDELPERRLTDVFPWLAPTRISDKTGAATNLADIHPTQCFWGMPRRVALMFEPNTEKLACDITGVVEDIIVRTYRTKPWGVNYQNVPHPLTPAYRVKPTDLEWLPVHPQPGGTAYRHWLSFVQASTTRKPAACIAEAERRLAAIGGAASARPRLRLLGYDMDNMKARGFVETEMPLLFASDAGRGENEQPRQLAFETLVQRLVGGATETVSLVTRAIKDAKGGDGGTELDLVRETFFKDTETAFFEAATEGLYKIESAPLDQSLLQDLANQWRETTLRPAAEKAFDREVPIAALTDMADFAAIEKMVNARRFLLVALAGYGPAGKRLFETLGMGARQAKAKKGVAS